jgi:hypothetical protein
MSADAQRPAGRRAALGAAAIACAAGLAAGLTGIGWGLPSEDRLDRLLPERDRRAAVLHLLSEPWPPGPAGAGEEDGDPTAACTGPIDPAAATGQGLWMRSELVPLLLGSDDPDEMETFGSVAKVFGRSAPLDERAFLYGHVYLAAVAGAEGLALATGVLPRVPSRADLLADPALLRRMYLLGRGVSVAGIAFLAGCVAYVVRREGAGWAGAVAAALAALAPMAIAAAHVAKPHAFAACFGFLALALAWRAANRMTAAAWGLAALALAVAASSSPPYAVLGLAAPTALLCARPRPAPGVWRRCALAFLATGAAAVVLLNPLAIARPDLLAANARHHLAGSGWGYGTFGAAKLFHFGGLLATRDLALATLPLVLAGLVACARRPSPFRLYVVAMTAIALALLGGFLGVPRIAVVLAPLFATLAGFGADACAHRFGGAWRAAGTAAAALLCTGLAADVAASAGSYTKPDPSDRAAAWILDHVPAGSCLTLRADRPLATFLPRFDLLRYRLRRIAIGAPAPDPAQGADTVVLSAESPERDPSAAWIAPRGPYRLLARFPEEPTKSHPLLLRAPRRPRTVLVLSAGDSPAVAGREP